jgi:hypothetical protein
VVTDMNVVGEAFDRQLEDFLQRAAHSAVFMA